MAQPETNQNQNFATNLPVGEILRRTRQHYDKSIRDVQDALRIRGDQIVAIEEGDVEKLPARVYAIGFVRSYAEFLGLDGDKMVELFKAQSVGQAAEPELNFPVTAKDSKAPPLWLALGCLLLLCIGLFFYMGGKNDERETLSTIPEVPQALKVRSLETAPSTAVSPATDEVAGTAEQGASLNADQEPPPVAEPAKPIRKGITLNIKENSWVEIRDANRKVILSRVLKAGEKYFVPERTNLTMSIGNAGGIEVEVDGKPLKSADGTLGEKGQVLRRIPLNGTALQQQFSARSVKQITNPIENLSR